MTPYEDVSEITALVARYNASASDFDPAGQSRCFAEDGEAHGYLAALGEDDVPLVGRAAIVSYLERAQAGSEIIHVIAQTSGVTVTGDSATARTQTAEWTKLTEGPFLQLLGHFDDVFRRVDGRWLFERRTLVPKRVSAFAELPFA